MVFLQVTHRFGVEGRKMTDGTIAHGLPGEGICAVPANGEGAAAARAARASSPPATG
ncbi:hypothetical protein SAMN05216188_102821 [Lentzea xinjiangensis]|uniref:Uncharacterized protein n=1 Tax=Lentzea xinjiangensis TaxID=402600 RepID=A0A1H9F7X8_9PSEU|nr:hypothetical protein [Lentzea xinjiangensis]SEQ34060.1 hypothetical protein SAMN05216188_102821 [Lentzea xinjiangensis]